MIKSYNLRNRQRSRDTAYRNVRPVLDTDTIGSSEQVANTKAAKTLNLFWANLRIQEVIGELQEDRSRNKELAEAIDFLKLAQSKMKEYSNRLREADHL